MDSDKYAPIALFVYNRPDHVERTLASLRKNTLAQFSDLYVFSDGSKNEATKERVLAVRKVISSIEGFNSVKVFQSEINKGLATSIIDGVSSIVSKSGKVIVMEDDLITSAYFLKFMNDALNFYQHFSGVFSISGYCHPPSLLEIPDTYKYDAYFVTRPTSWGWATWKDRWDKSLWTKSEYINFFNDPDLQQRFNQSGGNDLTDMLQRHFDGRIDSWAIRWAFTHFKYNGLSVYPVKSFVDNRGTDGSGIHSGTTDIYSNKETNAKESVVFPDVLFIDDEIKQAFKRIYRKKTFWDRVKNKLGWR